MERSLEERYTDMTDSLSMDMTDAEKRVTPPTQQQQQSVAGTDWNGPDDPDNPHNWPLWLRIYHATTPGLFGFAV
jgi:hypothetical protein